MQVKKSMMSDDLFMKYDEKQYGMSMPIFHYHNVYEIYILKTGKRNIFINNMLYETKEMDIALIKPNIYHRSYGDTPYTGICLNFSEGYLDRYFTSHAKEQILSCFKNSIISLDSSEIKEIEILAQEIDTKPKRKFIYLAYILDILNNAAQKYDEKYKLVNDSETSLISEYIRDNFMEIKNLEELAKKFYITKNHLCYLFKRQTGMTIISYINCLRIQEACFCLTDTVDAVVDISRNCGFDSPTYFNRVFKKMIGCTPIEFRKRQGQIG